MPNTFADFVGACFEAHARALVLYARQWLDDDGARDAVQEAFVRLLRHGHEPSNVRAWLYRTVRSTGIDGLRSAGRRQRREQQVAAERAVWFEPQADDAIDAATAQAALANLPDEQREVIVLRLWSGLTLAEVAELCPAPVSTVFSRYRTGLAALRRQFEEAGTIGTKASPDLSRRS
jgi:RNA polymerase sigma factor (sigma-70 family)